MLREFESEVFNFDMKKGLPCKLVLNNVPYFSQWESSSLIKEIIANEVSTQKDPLWKNSGAKTPKEYEFLGKKYVWNGLSQNDLET